MRKAFIYLLFAIWLPLYLSSQNTSNSQVKLFWIQKAEFHYEKYRWGNELYISIKGKADKILQGCVLVLSLWYYNDRVRYLSIPLNKEPKKRSSLISFSYTWGPLNKNREYVLAGKYELKLSCDLESQIPSLRKKVRKFLKNKSIASVTKTLYLGNLYSFQREDRIIKSFYKKRIKKAWEMYHNFQKYIEISKKNWDKIQWRKWMYRFQNELKKEEKIFAKFHSSIFCRRYPIAKGNIEEYYNLLLRFAKLSSIKLYQKHQLAPDQKDTEMDPFGVGIGRIDAIELNLKRLLKEAKAELKLSYTS